MNYKFEYFDELQTLVDQGRVRKKNHNHFPISVYTYGGAAMAPGVVWTPCMRAARGLVLDREGYVITRAFSKFDNIEQVASEDIPKGPYTVSNKYDGSLINISRYEGCPLISSRGSFTSEVVSYAQEIIKQKGGLSGLGEGYTISCELIHPKNRILVDYRGLKDLVILGAHYPTGEALSCFASPFPSATEFTQASWTEPRYHHPAENVREYWARFFRENPRTASDLEGFVLTWPNGFRLKAKSPEYQAAHRTVPIFSNILKTYLQAIVQEQGDLLRTRIPQDMEEKHKVLDDTDDEISSLISEAIYQSELVPRNIVASQCIHPELVFGCLNNYHGNRLRKLAAKILLRENAILGKIFPRRGSDK